MELTAAIEAVKWASLFRVTTRVYTDSKYVKDGIEQWVPKWKFNGWKTAAKKPVKNVELWQELERLNASFPVEWFWVKGHAGNPGNEMCDKLAREEAMRWKQ